jgi:hypothetical protein
MYLILCIKEHLYLRRTELLAPQPIVINLASHVASALPSCNFLTSTDMGKNRGAVSGLSRFLQVLKESETPGSTSTTARGASTSENQHQDEDAEAARPTKKRKTGLLGLEHERFDAGSLVQFYSHPSEVPDHLKKCKHQTPYRVLGPSFTLQANPKKKRFFSENKILLLI